MLKTIGPVIESGKNSISPNIVLLNVLFCAVRETFFNVSFNISLFIFSFIFIGHRALFVSMMLCPNDLANLYPSPVEPVEEYDLPPVAITSLSASYFLLSVKTINLSFSFLISFTV